MNNATLFSLASVGLAFTACALDFPDQLFGFGGAGGMPVATSAASGTGGAGGTASSSSSGSSSGSNSSDAGGSKEAGPDPCQQICPGSTTIDQVATAAQCSTGKTVTCAVYNVDCCTDNGWAWPMYQTFCGTFAAQNTGAGLDAGCPP